MRKIGSLTSLMALIYCTNVHAGLHCTDPSLKLGEVRAGVPLAVSFELVNRGQGPVEITEVRPSCGCLAWHLDRRLFQPGDFAMLKLEINTLTQPAGPQTWRIRLTCREGDKIEDLELSLSARVVTEVTVEPAALVIYASTPLTAIVTLRDRREKPLQLTRAATTTEHVQARFDPPSRDAEGKWGQRIRLEIGATYPAGSHAETLFLFTEDKEYRELRVPFKVIKQGKPRVSAAPGSVVVSAPAGQALPSRIVLLRGVAEQVVEVDQVEADHPAIRCTWAKGPGNHATLKVSFDSTRIQGGEVKGVIRVTLSGPGAETIAIPVAGVSR